jgi:hypothetical protein
MVSVREAPAFVSDAPRARLGMAVCLSPAGIIGTHALRGCQQPERRVDRDSSATGDGGTT